MGSVGSPEGIIHVDLGKSSKLLGKLWVILLLLRVEPDILKKEHAALWKSLNKLFNLWADDVFGLHNLVSNKGEKIIYYIRWRPIHHRMWFCLIRDVQTEKPRSSDSLGTRGLKLYFGVTPFGRPWKKQREMNWSNLLFSSKKCCKLVKKLYEIQSAYPLKWPLKRVENNEYNGINNKKSSQKENSQFLIFTSIRSNLKGEMHEEMATKALNVLQVYAYKLSDKRAGDGDH